MSDVEPARRKAKASAGWSLGRIVLVLVAALVVLVGLGYAGLAYLLTPRGPGTLEIAIFKPGPRVIVRQGGRQVAEIDPKTNRVIELEAGSYELELIGSKEGRLLTEERITISPGKKKLVVIQGGGR